MEKIEEIEVRECADLGPVIARADHQDRAIEVNRKLFYRLTPPVQEFVLCHEVCHLKYDDHDETRTNARAAQLYLSRATSAADRAERERFLSYMAGADGDYSNWWQILIEAIPAAVSLGFNIYGFIKDNNSGWYSWDKSTQQANLKVMLTQAFEQSRKSSTRSASDYFWDILYQFDNKDGSTGQFLNRSENSWVKSYVAKYEKQYSFGFADITPVDPLAFTFVKIGIGVVVGVAVFLLVRKIKNR